MTVRERMIEDKIERKRPKSTEIKKTVEDICEKGLEESNREEKWSKDETKA